MSGKECVCMECRIREAIHGEAGATFGVQTDVVEALIALGEVTSELLAHVPTADAKHFSKQLLVARQGWKKHPRVMVQQPVAGSA